MPIVSLALATLAISTQRPPHLVEAEALLAVVKPENTSYRHRPDDVDWKAATCHTDCSGFIARLIEHSYPQLGDAWLKANVGADRPLAKHFYAAFLEGKAFIRIERMAEISPGDFIAIRYESGVDNTGHIMLVAGQPEKTAPKDPVLPETEQYKVPIIDVTSSNHGTDDSRFIGAGRSRAGLGTGCFRLYADRGGKPIGYAWSMSPKSKFYGADRRKLAIGRLKLDSGS